MPIHLVCECGARVIAPIKRAGQSIRCPKCDSRIPVPLGEGQADSSFSSPTRPSRLESAISDLVTARQVDAAPPRRNDRVDPPHEKLRPAPVAPAMAPAALSRLEAAPKLDPAPPFHPSPSPVHVPVQIPAPRPAPVIAPVTAPAVVLLDEPPEIEITSRPAPITRPIRIVTASHGPRVDQGWLGAVYGLALLWSALAVVGIVVAVAESYFYYRAEELWRLQRWALLVIGASTIQLALAIYLAQVADWIACRAAAVVISCIAAFEAMILAVTLFSQRDGWFARSLELTPHMQNGRALGVALLLTLLSLLLAYTSASMSLAWQRYEVRGLKGRAAN